MFRFGYAGVMSSVTPAVRPLRRDAERNRLRILEAAREVYADRGLTAGFDEIARVAGVGVGTVYRRFPDRADLVEALFDQQVDDVVARVEAAAGHADAWEGLCAFARWGVQTQAADRGLAQVLSSAGHGHDRVAAGRERIEPAVRVLVRRAQQAGALRPDVTELDLGMTVAMISRIGGPGDHELRERFLTLALDGLATRRDAPSRLPGREPSQHDLGCVAELARPAR